MDKSAEAAGWNLDSLAGKMVQYCYLLEGLTGASLAEASKGAARPRQRRGRSRTPVAFAPFFWLKFALASCAACAHPGPIMLNPVPTATTPAPSAPPTTAGDFEALRGHLRRLASDAYRRKVAMIDAAEPGLMPEAQKFFVLTQTDSLWKEHLQARPGAAAAAASQRGCAPAFVPAEALPHAPISFGAALSSLSPASP